VQLTISVRPFEKYHCRGCSSIHVSTHWHKPFYLNIQKRLYGRSSSHDKERGLAGLPKHKILAGELHPARIGGAAREHCILVEKTTRFAYGGVLVVKCEVNKAR
jgi:hypothetical protein